MSCFSLSLDDQFVILKPFSILALSRTPVHCDSSLSASARLLFHCSSNWLPNGPSGPSLFSLSRIMILRQLAPPLRMCFISSLTLVVLKFTGEHITKTAVQLSKRP